MLLSREEAKKYLTEFAEQDKVDVVIISLLGDQKEQLYDGKFKYLMVCLMPEKLPDDSIFKFTVDIIWKQKKKISAMEPDELIQLAKELKAIASFITKIEISNLLFY